MKNNFFYKLLLFFFFYFSFTNFVFSEQFNFDVTEIEILDNGNLYKGLRRGKIKSNEGIIIEANTFVYNKKTNIINAQGNVKIEDEINNYIIFSDQAIYEKNKEIITTKGNSKAIDQEGRVITANEFVYNKIENIIDANIDVKIEDEINNYIIFSDQAIYEKNKEIITTKGNSKAIDQEGRVITANEFVYNKIENIIDAKGDAQIENEPDDYIVNSEKLSYFKSEEKIITKGITEATIESKYIIKSKDVTFLLKQKKLSSKRKSILKDHNSQIYYLDEFLFLTNNKVLKGKNILTITNYNLPKSDKFYFSEGIFNLENKNFTAKDTKIKVHKNVFGDPKNDPRIYGVSSSGDYNLTTINKGIFTSCQKRDGCSPWSIKSEEISHNKEKKQISYKNAFLNIYDIPILYFPKFFHPDPTVKRQSGFLKPEINKSNVLGSSFTQPYFKVLSNNKDFTFSPTWFDNKILSLQNEYRQSNKNSEFLADFGFIKGYKSPITKEKNNMSHVVGSYNLDLNLSDYESSNLLFSFEQVSNDTYLKVFDAHITKSEVRPENLNQLKNQIKLNLSHEKYSFETGFQSFENLTVTRNNDRYQYILPYYNFDTVLENEYFDGSISFSSSGSNNLSNTNDLKSNIINDLNYTTTNYFTNYGFINSFNLSFKNLNSIGKKNINYKSSPQIELLGLIETNASLPLIKKQKNYNNYLTPKMSLRFNPSDMKNNSTSSKKISTGNIFSLNRLGLGDTFESGRSLTLGIDYKREKKSKALITDEEKQLEAINNFFEVKLATVIRDKEENFIPKSSTMNRKNSNIFGSITNNFSENFKVDYNFALDNDLKTFEYNEISTTFSINNLVTTFDFIEENGEIGDSNIFGTSISYNLDEYNSFSFKTRRNRKINLTEYYDLVYEYKNDCLTAGIKYKKSYYEDRDLKPTENLLFTITLFPLTTYEHNAEDLIN